MTHVPSFGKVGPQIHHGLRQRRLGLRELVVEVEAAAVQRHAENVGQLLAVDALGDLRAHKVGRSISKAGVRLIARASTPARPVLRFG